MRGSTKWRSGEADEERVGAEPSKKERDFDGWIDQLFTVAWCVGMLAWKGMRG